MAYYIDGNGIHTTGIIYASDLTAVANYYRQWFPVNYSAPGKGATITVNDWNHLSDVIAASLPTSGSVTYSAAGLPRFSGGVIRASSWPAVSAMFGSATFEYTTPGTYTVSVPVGASVMTADQMIGGGGGGGGSAEGQGGVGGSGGSGGYIENVSTGVTGGQTITIVVGRGGGGQLCGWTGGHADFTAVGIIAPDGSYVTFYNTMDGGSTFVQVNGNTVFNCTGGGGGPTASYYQGSGSPGGTAGSPNGNPGTRGGSGGPNGSAYGVSGANSQMGTGGAGGGNNTWYHGPTGPDGRWYIYGPAYGQNASGYGAGGGSGSTHDRSQPYAWGGGAGSGGYCRLTFKR